MSTLESFEKYIRNLKDRKSSSSFQEVWKEHLRGEESPTYKFKVDKSPDYGEHSREGN